MLQRLADDWRSYAGGRRWRCRGPAYLCEVDDAGRVPSLLKQPGIAERVRRIRAFYAGRLALGRLDQFSTGLDVLVANAMTESYGTVPSPLEVADLNRLLDRQPELPLDLRLDRLLRDIGADARSRWLVRREPGYASPATTPARVSVGAHHMLLSTAQALPSQRTQVLREQVVQLAANSLHSAQRAVEYLNENAARHEGELPLIAATYNAGRPRQTDGNLWHLVQYGEHIDRWLGYYNASRQSVVGTQPAVGAEDRGPPPAQPVSRATALPAGSPAAALAVASAAGAPAGGSATQLSAHFTLAELIASDKARELQIDNQPGPLVQRNLRRLAERLEQVRHLLGDRDIHVNSAYRCEALNRAVGSKGTSMHLHGLAADIVCPRFGTPLQVAQAIAASGLGFDQVIHEFGRWVHLGLAPDGAAERRQQLTIDRLGTHAGLLPTH